MSQQISYGARYKIEHLLDFSSKKIGEILNFHRSTIYRELARGRKNGYDYNADLAQKYYLERHGHRGSYIIKEDIKGLINKYLTDYQWNPGQIIGHFSKIRSDFPKSTDTIYRYIYSTHLQDGIELFKQLRLARKKKKRRSSLSDYRGKLTERTSYKSRPIEADERTELGHLEADVDIGKNEKSKVLVTLVDRCSRYTLIGEAKSKSKDHVYDSICKLREKTLVPWKTITFDNGKEIACHKQVEEELFVLSYFADPYSSWQRDTNENTNGLIRQ
ncbi:MAG: IS30 family transposase [Flavobacteriales bacterium]